MKKEFLFIVLLVQSTFLIAQNAKENIRSEKLFNFDWKFQPGDPEEAQSVEFDDSGWRILDLPHDFQIEQPWDKSGGGARGYKAMGTGWYRKSFQADPSWKDKKVLLDFEGLMLHGTVWFNGQKAVDIEYGYLGYEADITQLINYNGENVVAIRASTGKQGNSRWYTGGGLFRDVHLVVKDTISIARHGVFVTTPKVSKQSADVNIQVELEGFTREEIDLEINAKIFGPNGEQVAETKGFAPKAIRLNIVEVALPLATVIAPRLWSTENPNLYTAEVSLVRDDQVIDRVTETFGIRTIEFSPEHGFKLNGKKVFLKGISNHHDLGALGAAVYDQAIERLFLQLKAFGFNHVRLSHNPYSKSFLRLADKHGILIVDELTDKWSNDRYWPGSKPFVEIWHKITPEWIRRARNHPSVILWSLGNELQHDEWLGGFPTGDWGVTTYKILDVLVKRYDTTRKTTVGLFPSRSNAITRHDPSYHEHIIPPELSEVTEIASFNYLHRDYLKYLEYNPNLIIYQSEATTGELTAPFFGMDYGRMVGLAYWGAVEYWGESTGWPKKGWNYSFFNHALQPFPQAYLLKSAFEDEPLVHIGVVDKQAENLEWNDVIVGRLPISSHWNRKEGSNLNLFTYTNAEEVELLVNNKSMGVQKNKMDSIERRNIIYWQNVPYGKGGHVTAIARTNGKEVARHRLETTGRATAVKLVAEQTDWKADGMGLQYVKVYAVDNNGRVVPDMKGDVLFEVSGTAKLLAVDNGNHYTDEVFTRNQIKWHNGFAMAILRSTTEPGQIQLTVKSDGLKSANVRLNVQ